MIFTKNDYTGLLYSSDELGAQIAFSILDFGVRQGFTKYDLPYIDDIYDTLFGEEMGITQEANDYLEDLVARIIIYLNENCVDGVYFFGDDEGLHILPTEQ